MAAARGQGTLFWLRVATEFGCRLERALAGASPWYERLPLLKGWLDVFVLASCGGASHGRWSRSEAPCSILYGNH